jgi:hypothetical protein
MTEHLPLGITPMRATDIHFQVDRVYRESGAFQWVRETYINSLEAEATRCEFGIEWQAVENRYVYRRTIADDGRGMVPEELRGFFNTWGGGGKPIGGVHENFGIGAKSSLLPWNQHGIVVVSWVDGDPAMIWLKADPNSGEYGLRQFHVEDDEGNTLVEDVITPFNDVDHGCDWAAIKPDWITDHGTVIVLLGNEPAQNTVLGDPSREESDIKGVSSYLNRRLWDIPSGVKLSVDELRLTDPKTWPESETMAHQTGGPQRRTNRRTIEGAKHYVEYRKGSTAEAYNKGKLVASDEMPLSDGTVIEWFLWEGERPDVHSYAAKGGFIAAVYEDELYDVTSHHATYRSFGVTEGAVRSKLWLVAHPPMYGEGGWGVYPRGDRNSLLVQGGARAGDPLPFNDWGAEFSDKMPDPIRDALRSARAGSSGTVDDKTWRDRLADRFGARWKLARLLADERGKQNVAASQAGKLPRAAKPKRRVKPSPSGGKGGTSGPNSVGAQPGLVPAKQTKIAGGIPTYELVRSHDLGANGMIAAWVPNHPEHPEGAILIATDHPVIEEQVAHWQNRYPPHLEEDVRREVLAVYGEIAVAKLAHSEQLKSLVPSHEVENDLRSDAALTMSLLGLISEDAVISTRIGGKLGKLKRKAS